MRAMKELLQIKIALITISIESQHRKFLYHIRRIETLPSKSYCKSTLLFVFDLIINYLTKYLYIEHE